MPRVIHFEIHASRPQALVDFYSKLFGWTFTKWNESVDYWTIRTGTDAPGIDGGLVLRRGAPPSSGQAVNAFPCTVQVDALDRTLADGQALGSTVAVPKMPIPGIGWLGYLTDPDGNLFGIMQPDNAAK